MKIRVINSFFDRKNDYMLREAGQEIEVPEDRAEQLIGLGLVLPTEEKQEEDFPMNPPEEPAEKENPAEKPVKKPAARKKTKKNEEA